MGQLTAGNSGKLLSNGFRGSFGESTKTDTSGNVVKCVDMGSIRFEITCYPRNSSLQTSTVGYIRKFVNNKWENDYKFLDTVTYW